MKKIFLISLIVAALFSSCQDDVINTIDGNTIRFDNAFVEQPQSRANDITTSNLDAFHVHGWMTNSQGQSALIFNKEEVRKNGGAWTYNGGGRYWFANKRFEFLAFAPLTAQYTLAEDHQSLVYENNTNDDFIFASYTRNIDNVVDDPEDVRAVPLQFSHVLSRVFIQFINEFKEDDIVVTVEDVRLSGFASVADFNLTDSTWTPTAHNKNNPLAITFPPTTVNRPDPDVEIPTTKDKNTANTNHFYLIPETIGNEVSYKLTFDLTVYQENIQIGKFNHEITLAPMTLESGKNYRLSAKLNNSNVNPEAEIQPITFTVEVLPWGKDIEGEVGFPGSED